MRRLTWLLRPDRAASHPGIVIGGASRSGTTLIRVMLDSHPAIASGPESGLFCRRLRERTLSRYFDMSLLDLQRLKWRSPTFTEFVGNFLTTYAARQDADHWAEKTPQNVFHIGWILDHFPNVVFCHVVRDGRAVVNSLKHHPRYKVVGDELVPTGQSRPVDRCIDRWLLMVEAGLRYEHDPRVVEIRYEDLVDDPELTLDPLLSRAGLSWDPRMASFHEVKTRSRDVLHDPQNAAARAPLDEDPVDRWKSELSSQEVRLVERRGAHVLERLGYELVS